MSLYFAYGSNCDPAQMAARCPGAILVSTATLPAAEFSWFVNSTTGSTRATLRYNANASLQGTLWRNVPLDVMDRFEGSGYERTSVTVATPTGRVLATTYAGLENPDTGLVVPPQGCSYARRVSVARARHGFDTPNARLIAVYGSLMTGFHNSSLLKGADLIHDRIKIDGFDLLDLGAFPGVVPGTGVVTAQAYVVNEAMLRNLDHLEGHPTFYRRERVMTQGGTTCWIYVLQRDANYPIIASGCWRDHNDPNPQQRLFGAQEINHG